MRNDRLHSALRGNGYNEAQFGEEIGVDPKTVQRWITKGRTPHPNTARRAAQLLEVPAEYLWPELRPEPVAGESGEVANFYPHRSEVPKQSWLEMAAGAKECIEFLTFASLFFGEDNPESIELIKHKAANGVRVRFILGDPDSPVTALRGEEEQIPVQERIRMAMAYYRPLIGAPGVEFHIHDTTLYNSIYRFDDQMMINQHIYGTYGYLAPILHLRKVDTGDLFATYERSFGLVWEKSRPYELAS